MKNVSLRERDATHIWHPYTQHQNADFSIPIVKGEGVFLYDEAGNEYMDAISSWWVNLHGHAHPYIAEKLYKQALTLEHVIFANFTHEPAIELAERLLSLLPGNLTRIFYSDNGSTAVEVALKMAIQFWRNNNQPEKKKILAFEHAYHGDTFGAMSVSGRSLFTEAFRDLLFDTVYIELPDSGNLEKIKSVIVSQDGQLAAFIYEPLLQAAGGMRMYEPKYMNELLSFVREQQILCIADEVLTGFGRTGQLFASEALNGNADIICLSKGLTGGTMALGVTACGPHIFDAFLSGDSTKTFFHGHSYTANPLACTAGLASLDLLEEKSCRDQIKTIQTQHEKFVREELSLTTHGLFQNIRILGTILAFELNTGNSDYVNPVGRSVMKQALTQGIYLRPLGNTVYLMPPYCISPKQMEKIYAFILALPNKLKV